MKTVTLFSSFTALSTARLDFSWPNFSDSGMKFILLIFYAVVSLAINKAMYVQLMNEELKQRKRCHNPVSSMRRASKLKGIRAAVFNKAGLTEHVVTMNIHHHNNCTPGENRILAKLKK